MSRIRPGVLRTLRLKLRSRAGTRHELDEELRFHVEARVERLVASGMDPDAARREAERRLGLDRGAHGRLERGAARRDRTIYRREIMGEWAQDLRYAVRGLQRRPGFTLVGVLTLALGIGGSTAIFSAVWALLLRPLPFPDPDALMRVSLVRPGAEAFDSPERESVWSYPKYEVFRDAQDAFQDLAVYTTAGPAMITSETPERVAAEIVGATYFRTLGIEPRVGRAFRADEDTGPGTRTLVVLTDALWRTRFGADPDLIGRSLPIDGRPHEVIGVAPAGFRGLSGRADLFLPAMSWGETDLSEPQSHVFNLVGRRRADVGPEPAQQAVLQAGARVDAVYPAEDADAAWSARAEPLDAARVAPQIRRSVLVLFGAVGFVLLVVCVNLASLLLGRALARRSDFAVRRALGASGLRVGRLLLAESLLLSLVGGLAGIGVAAAGTALLRRVDPIALLRSNGVGLVDFSTVRLEPLPLVFGIGLALLTGLVFGLLPAWSAGQAPVVATLKEGGEATGSRASGRRTGRSVLVVVEVAAAVVLLAGSGLMLRSLGRLLAVDPGFDGEGVLTARMALAPGTPSADSLPSIYAGIEERLAALPGVAEAGLALCAPLSGGCGTTVMTFADRPEIGLDQAPEVQMHMVTGGWFGTLGIALLRGRAFTRADIRGAPRVVVLSRTAAERFWPGEDPLGREVALYRGGFHEGATVVGIVGDVRYETPEQEPRADVYVPLLQATHPRPTVFVKAAGGGDLAGPLRGALREAAPHFAVEDIVPLEERTAAATAQARFGATLLTAFAGVALLLAVLGIYGVMSFAVLQRRRELGVRMALGADRGRVLRLVIREGIALATIGGLIGIVAALALTRVLRSLLYETTPGDPVVLGAIAGLLLATAWLAAWLPARRAAALDPVAALRG
ncbi:MAG: ABC transporter permease [Gemmatimonadota bacterium]